MPHDAAHRPGPSRRLAPRPRQLPPPGTCGDFVKLCTVWSNATTIMETWTGMKLGNGCDVVDQELCFIGKPIWLLKRSFFPSNFIELKMIVKHAKRLLYNSRFEWPAILVHPSANSSLRRPMRDAHSLCKWSFSVRSGTKLELFSRLIMIRIRMDKLFWIKMDSDPRTLLAVFPVSFVWLSTTRLNTPIWT